MILPQVQVALLSKLHILPAKHRVRRFHATEEAEWSWVDVFDYLQMM